MRLDEILKYSHMLQDAIVSHMQNCCDCEIDCADDMEEVARHMSFVIVGMEQICAHEDSVAAV